VKCNKTKQKETYCNNDISISGVQKNSFLFLDPI